MRRGGSGKAVSQPDLSVIIACYNEMPHLPASVAEIRRVLDWGHISGELVFVDDGSTDGTRAEIDRLIAAREHGSMRTVFHEQNRGRGAAVRTGIGEAQGTFVGFLDIDLEVHARYIPAALDLLRQGADAVIGKRIYWVRLGSLSRFAASRGYNLLVRKTMGVPYSDTEAGFKFWRSEALKPVLPYLDEDGWFWDTQFVLETRRAGLKVVELPCVFERRADKKSSVNLFSDSWDYFVALWRYRKRLKRRS